VKARGYDPGGTVGWCDVERESAGVFRYVASGTWEASEVKRGLGLPIDAVGIHLHAIETPEEMHPNDVTVAFRSAEAGVKASGVHSAAAQARIIAAAGARIVQTVRNLLETRALAERIASILAMDGARIVEPTATEVRHALGVKLGAQRGRGPKLTVDQQIAHIIPLAIRGWPKRSNPHVRDAAAAALCALQQAELGEAIRRGAPEAARGFAAPPPGTYGPGDYGPDSFGGSDLG
jgi:hypothetical protein